MLTSSLEDQLRGPLPEELAETAPAEYEGRIRRSGVVNALDDPDFAAAVQATGRRNLIIAGVTNDVCTVYPTLTALQQGPAARHQDRKIVDGQASGLLN